MGEGGGRKVILVVGSDSEGRATLARYLAFLGFDVEVAGSPKACIRAARANPPSLIILDLATPGLKPLRMLDRLAMDDATRYAPVLAIDPRANPGRFRDAGFSGSLPALFPPFRVLLEIERCLDDPIAALAPRRAAAPRTRPRRTPRERPRATLGSN